MRGRGKKLSNEGALGYVMEKVSIDSERAERRPYEESWFGDLAYFFGAHHFVPENGYIRPPKNLRRRKDFYQVNLILPKVMRAMSKVLGVEGTFRVMPKSGSREDRHAAELAELALEHVKSVTEFDVIKGRAMLWAAICGSGFIRPYWNPRAGTKRRIYLQDDSDDPDIRPRWDHDMARDKVLNGRFRDTWPGEVDATIIEPFQAWPDPQARGGGIKDCAWFATNTARPRDDIYDQYGVEVSADSSELRGAEVYREVFAFLASPLQGTEIARRARTADLAREIEYIERPSRVNGDLGRHIIIAGGKVIKNDVNPYAATGNPLNVVKYDWFPCEGRFWGLGLVEQLRNPNKAYNESRTHMIAFQKRQGFVPTYIPKGSGVQPVQIAQMHGTILEYNASAGAPTFGQAPQMPPYIAGNAEIADREMSSIAAQADPQTSKLPGQIRSGVGIKAMQGDNNAVLTPVVSGMLQADKAFGTQCLQLVSLYYDTSRVMEVSGRARHLDVRYFTGPDLRSHTEVRLVAQPGRMDSVEASQATLIDAAETGFLDPTNPIDKVLFWKGMAFQNSDEWIEAQLQEDEAEERLIKRIIDDPEFEVTPPNEWMDPMIRSNTLERHMNSIVFENHPPEIAQRIALRWQGMREMMAARIQAQMEAQAQAQGTPAPKGEASQPKRGT